MCIRVMLGEVAQARTSSSHWRPGQPVPDPQEIIAMSGDGGIAMLMGDLLT